MASQSTDWFSAGGEVMVPLLGFSILGIALVLERLIFWGKVLKRTDRLVQETLHLYRRNPRAAFGLLEKNSDIPIARIFLAALELEQATPEEFRLALESSAQAEIPLLKRFNTIFETIISLSPLLGLLGTVLGLIRSFAALQPGNVGGTNTANVTGGISTALISTAAGLTVAIVTLIFANSFRGLYLRQLALIQEYGGQLELLYRRRFERRMGTYIPSNEPHP
ncbi:MotA/TolQ/ExbB proton channel family protein [Alkalinema sp. FACHB-956]|uniref:MotA/TolQ/ExbB proton channel family protein n=1 Tax=Alkalinema sp. FACHB-956 TaxID=2692768 RepID=UPI001684696E|nr:MotA/TolQ/ExbB proton channel family protein [Alkalinema sp. FACHB-956]MBD2328852.1 MotA/TolQ/ExbB proton channel family protein [Alkalinema sp. FACHB-956]